MDVDTHFESGSMLPSPVSKESPRDVAERAANEAFDGLRAEIGTHAEVSFETVDDEEAGQYFSIFVAPKPNVEMEAVRSAVERARKELRNEHLRIPVVISFV